MHVRHARSSTGVYPYCLCAERAFCAHNRNLLYTGIGSAGTLNLLADHALIPRARQVDDAGIQTTVERLA